LIASALASVAVEDGKHALLFTTPPTSPSSKALTPTQQLMELANTTLPRESKYFQVDTPMSLLTQSLTC
jgi:hypothetical protein